MRVWIMDRAEKWWIDKSMVIFNRDELTCMRTYRQTDKTPDRKKESCFHYLLKSVTWSMRHLIHEKHTHLYTWIRTGCCIRWDIPYIGSLPGVFLGDSMPTYWRTGSKLPSRWAHCNKWRLKSIHCSSRNTMERTNSVLKKRFHWLQAKLR